MPAPIMLVTHQREKLVNAILYFAHHTESLGKIKLLKLLYLLDFEHFAQTGRSVTGMDYAAWKFGPVPVRVMQEWDDPEPDLAAAISIEPTKVIHYSRENIVPKASFDDRHFTKRELRIMEGLAEKYHDTLSPDMIDVTHAENGAWAKVWQDGKGMNQIIPYDLSVAKDNPHRDDILAIAEEQNAIRKAFQSRA